MFCSHNEVDLEPVIVVRFDVDDSDEDWVIVRCTCCKQRLGKRYRLTDLVDKAIEERRKRLRSD